MPVIRRVLVMAGFAALCTVSPLAAQARAATSAPFCVSGRPLRVCRSYLVFELTGAREVRSTAQEVSLAPEVPSFTQNDLASYLAWTVGGMINRDSTHAMGLAFQAGPTNEGVRMALQGRGRTWLPNNGTFDVAVGGLSMAQTTPSGRSTQAYGLTAESAVGLGDQVSVFVSGDLVGSARRRSAAVHVGGRLGSYAGMAGTALIIVVVSSIVTVASRHLD